MVLRQHSIGIQEFILQHIFVENAEKKAFELMDDCQPRVEVSELDEEE